MITVERMSGSLPSRRRMRTVDEEIEKQGAGRIDTEHVHNDCLALMSCSGY